MRKDKLVVEVLLAMFLFLVFYIFAEDISSFFHGMEGSTDIKPVQSLFWFLGVVFHLLGHWLVALTAFMIVAGIIYLIERREH